MTATPPRSRVYIVDDEPAVRHALKRLCTAAGMKPEPCAEAQELLVKYDPLLPGCILLDVRMPRVNGFELYEQLRKRHGDVPVIMMTGYADIAMATRAIRAGAVDFLQKPVGERELLERIGECLKADQRQRHYRRCQARWNHLTARLTGREREILERMLAGDSSKVIANTLGISRKTVDVHRAHILEKMETRNIAELFSHYFFLAGRAPSAR